MKIASLVPYKIIPAIKGGEKGIFYFLKYLAKYVKVTAFTVAENEGTVEGIDFIGSLGSQKNRWRYINPVLYWSIKRKCRSMGLRHIVIEHPYYAWLGYLLKRFGGLKVIFHSHNIEAARFKSMGKSWWRIMHYYERFAHRYADFNFFITEEDLAYAVDNYQLSRAKCAVITYGIEANSIPTRLEKQDCKAAVCGDLELPTATRLILFNGTLDYAPNREGLDRILNEINPLLLKRTATPYKIIICGLRLPDVYDQLKAYGGQHIIYKGFVEDIDQYFKAADLFINPITDGGGIKTKLVEALGANTPAVSFKAGAYGIPQHITGKCLTVVDDGDTSGFAGAIAAKLDSKEEDISPDFYEHFGWNAIAKKAAGIISSL